MEKKDYREIIIYYLYEKFQGTLHDIYLTKIKSPRTNLKLSDEEKAKIREEDNFHYENLKKTWDDLIRDNKIVLGRNNLYTLETTLMQGIRDFNDNLYTYESFLEVDRLINSEVKEFEFKESNKKRSRENILYIAALFGILLQSIAFLYDFFKDTFFDDKKIIIQNQKTDSLLIRNIEEIKQLNLTLTKIDSSINNKQTPTDTTGRK